MTPQARAQQAFIAIIWDVSFCKLRVETDLDRLTGEIYGVAPGPSDAALAREILRGMGFDSRP